jgi:plastocyanin
MVDTECKTATCIQGVCGLINVPDQTPTKSQAAGDCQLVVCDGQGNGVTKIDDTDVPDDNKECTKDLCSGGVSSHTALATGTLCSQGTGKLCDGAGTCVECNVDADCASGLCSANACVTVNGCGPASTMLTSAMVTSVGFGGGIGFAYSPKCLKVKVGTKVTFDGSVVGAFASHPFIGGEVKNGLKFPAITGPFIPVTNDAAISSKTFTMTSAGTFPFYCDFHALGGMTGTVFVVP